MVVKGCWAAEICEGILKIFRFINSRGYAAIEYQVNNNLECILYVERDIVKQHLDVFEHPSKVVTLDCLKQACIAISKLSICVGASIHDIPDVVAAADNGVLYRNKANEMQATIKTLLTESSTVLKSAHCTGLIFRDDLVATKVTCGSCTKAKTYLQERHFNILLACCDGASENRKMLNLNMVKDKTFANNPFSGMPLFFISDPPHLMKKLRNNLYKSGYITETSRFTRHLRQVSNHTS